MLLLLSYKKAYGVSLDTLVDNNGMNKYLLSRAMMEAFPPVSLKALVEGFGLVEKEGGLKSLPCRICSSADQGFSKSF